VDVDNSCILIKMEGSEVHPTKSSEQVDSETHLPAERTEEPEAVDEAGKEADSKAREEDPPQSEEEASQGHEEEKGHDSTSEEPAEQVKQTDLKELDPSEASQQGVQGEAEREAEPVKEDQSQAEEVKGTGEEDSQEISVSISDKAIKCPEPSLRTPAKSEQAESSYIVESIEARTMNKSRSAEQDIVHSYVANPTDSEQPRAGQAAPHVLEFTIHYAASFGDSLYITGNSPALGNWNPKEGLQLEWTAEDIWTGSAEVDSEELEYKYVCVGATETRWEGGPNHAISEHMSELSKEVSLVRDLWRD
jgi:hypothetical protein